MARGINKVILIGNLGADPETRNSTTGNAITNINLATDESYKDKNTGQTVPKTEWHRIVMFNRLAEVAQQYLKKGSKIYIEGKLQTRKWTDTNGVERYTTEIVANEMTMLDSAQGDSNGGGQAAPAPQKAAPQKATPKQQAAPAPQAAPQPSNDPIDDFDDDIPF